MRSDCTEPNFRLRTTVDLTGTRPHNTENTYRRHRRTQQTNKYLRMQANNRTRYYDPRWAWIRYERTGRRTDADLCSLRRTEQENRSEVLPDVHGRSSKQREPPRNPATDAMEQKQRENKNRERSSEAVRQHFVLSTRDPFFFVVLFLL